MTPLAMSPAEVAPPPVDDEPLVVEPEPPVEAPEEPTGAVGEPLAPDVPSRATELPFAVTGGDPGVVTWLPPPVDDDPLVVEPEPPVEAPEEPTGAVGEPLAPDVPSRATELPFAVTGGDPGVVTWLPPPVDDDPLVVEPEPPVEPPEEPPDELAGATDEPVLLELPSTATELPLAVTGGDTGAVTWLPPPVEDEPLVVEPEVLPAELVGAADEPVLFEVPSTATELPLATTGAATEVVAWLPPRVLFAPVVPDCAEA